MIEQFERWETEIRAIVLASNHASAIVEVATHAGIEPNTDWLPEAVQDRALVLGRKGGPPSYERTGRFFVRLRYRPARVYLAVPEPSIEALDDNRAVLVDPDVHPDYLHALANCPFPVFGDISRPGPAGLWVDRTKYTRVVRLRSWHHLGVMILRDDCVSLPYIIASSEKVTAAEVLREINRLFENPDNPSRPL